MSKLQLHFSLLFFVFLLIVVKETHGLKTLGLDPYLATYVPTPFKQNGDINVAFVKKMAQKYARDNITTLIIGSYDGEGPSMDLCTRQELIEAWVRFGVPLGLKIIPDVGAIAFPDTLKLVRFCARIEVTAIFVLPELAYKAKTKNEIIEDLKAIYNVAPNLYIIFHDLQFLTNPVVNSTEVYKEASLKIPSFMGMATDYNNAVELYRIFGPKMDKLIFVTTNEVNAPLVMKIGIHLSIWPSLFPEVVLKIVAAANAGDCGKAAYLQQSKLNPLIKTASGAKGDVVIVYISRMFLERQKYVYYLRTGMDLNERLPLREIDEDVAIEIRTGLIDLNVEIRVSGTRYTYE